MNRLAGGFAFLAFEILAPSKSLVAHRWEGVQQRKLRCTTKVLRYCCLQVVEPVVA